MRLLEKYMNICFEAEIRFWQKLFSVYPSSNSFPITLFEICYGNAESKSFEKR